MKMQLIKVIVAVMMVTVFTGCFKEDFLNTTPQTSILDAEAFSTPGKILAQVNNLYGQLQNQSLYGGRFIIFNEQRADEFGQNDGNAATGSAVWNQNVASTNEYINFVWSAAYRAINASNILMEKLSTTTVISDSLAKNYIAEAKFVRALAYLSLVQTYAKPFNSNSSAPGVPLRLTAITTAGHNDLSRSSVSEVYTQIIKDLNEAEANLPVSYSSASLNSSRAHKATAIALKTRVYLNMSAWDKVIEEAGKIVSPTPPFSYSGGSVVHKLESDFASIWSGSYTGAEAIFFIPFANSTTETPASQYALAFNYVAQPIIFLSNEGIKNNAALNASTDRRASLLGTNSANKRILKKFNITTSPFRDYVPVIRYAEVLLNYAEASAQLGDLSTSQSLLKAVRNRSDASFAFADADINSSPSLVQTILTERRIEFLGEGLRLQDLQRYGLELPSKTGSIGVAPKVLPTAGNYIWPIPSEELSTNKLCVPN